MREWKIDEWDLRYVGITTHVQYESMMLFHAHMHHKAAHGALNSKSF